MKGGGQVASSHVSLPPPCASGDQHIFANNTMILPMENVTVTEA